MEDHAKTLGSLPIATKTIIGRGTLKLKYTENGRQGFKVKEKSFSEENKEGVSKGRNPLIGAKVKKLFKKRA
jgi:hypothetical protein